MLILASCSPRRKQLLSMIRPQFMTVDPQVDETLPAAKMSPRMTAGYLSRKKARAAAGASGCTDGDVIVGADTLVAVDGEILGKPNDCLDAARMLERLSGRTHEVYTGVTIIRGRRERTFVSRTRVTFYPLRAEEIDAYIDTEEPMDKAGAYAIQGKGCVFVRRISGDYYNVVGLPVAQLERVLRKME